jgi:hypothetical protein
MNTQTEFFYTRSQFEPLSPEQKAATDALFLYIGGHTLSGQADCDDERVHEYLNIFRPVEGCIPEEEIEDDLTESVRRKFSFLLSAACQWAERELVTKGKRLHEDFNFCLLIDASVTDCTHVSMIDYDKSIVYLHEWTKAWHYHFESIAAVADEMLRIKNLLVKKVMERETIYVVLKDGCPEMVQYPEGCPYSVTVVDYAIDEVDADRLQISPIDGEACRLLEF